MNPETQSTAVDSSQLGQLADMLGDLFDAAAQIFGQHRCASAELVLPCGKHFSFRRGEFFVDNANLSNASLAHRAEAARAVPALFTAGVCRRDAIALELQASATFLSEFIREHSVKGEEVR